MSIFKKNTSVCVHKVSQGLLPVSSVGLAFSVMVAPMPASFVTRCASLRPDSSAPSAVAIFVLVASPANRMRP